MSAIEQQVNECPICMECIELNKNCVTTECGHHFHANCLMTSIAHNGFGCPYCRTQMANEPADDESTEYESVDEEDVVDPLEDNDMLRGFRFFFNNIEGYEHDPDDVEEEQANEEIERQERAEAQEVDPNIPSIGYIADKLKDNNVFYSDLVTAMLLGHDEFDGRADPNREDDRIFGLIRIIISNYDPNRVEERPVPPVPPAPIANQEQGKKVYPQNFESCIDIFV